MDTSVKQFSLVDGVSATELRQINDPRGSVLHMLRCDATEFTQFGECYFSEILPGAVKAWKRHRFQTQNITVPIGRIRFVIYDDRKNSATRGNIQVFELGRPDAYLRLKIPPHLWYGFTCISKTAALIANCTDTPHDPNDNEIVSLHDPAVPYSWTIDSKETLLL